MPSTTLKPGHRHLEKGWGPWRCEWWSVCSVHYVHQNACVQCQAGTWINMTTHSVDKLVWRHAPRVALWWHNRPNSKAKQTLRRFFPGLR